VTKDRLCKIKSMPIGACHKVVYERSKQNYFSNKTIKIPLKISRFFEVPSCAKFQVIWRCDV